jgi:hypothetical protein
MRDRPAGREMRFRATQTIHLRQPEFEWRASAGPLTHDEFKCDLITL